MILILFVLLKTLLSLMPENENLNFKWKLSWHDEFNYSGLPDSAKWSYETGYIRNDELQYYTQARIKNTRVENGHLIIESYKEDYKEYKYTSASLHSKSKGDWLYGRIEIRAKVPGSRGTLAAFWMLPTNPEYGDWLKSGEIDLMECVGYEPNKLHFTIHTQAFNEFAGTKKGRHIELKEDSPQSQFHLYAMEWYPEKLIFFLDGRQVFEFNKQGENSEVWPFDKHFYLIMNIAIGGSWGGLKGIDDSEFPQRMTIDYVRIYTVK